MSVFVCNELMFFFFFFNWSHSWHQYSCLVWNSSFFLALSLSLRKINGYIFWIQSGRTRCEPTGSCRSLRVGFWISTGCGGMTGVSQLYLETWGRETSSWVISIELEIYHWDPICHVCTWQLAFWLYCKCLTLSFWLSKHLFQRHPSGINTLPAR